MGRSPAGRLMILAFVALGTLIGLIHIAFGLANFQPGFPELEGVAAITAGLAILAAVAVARRSMHRALLTAFLGTLPLVAWFAYAVPVERSSDPIFFWASLVLPTMTGLSLLASRRSRVSERRTVANPHRSGPTPGQRRGGGVERRESQLGEGGR